MLSLKYLIASQHSQYPLQNVVRTHAMASSKRTIVGCLPDNLKFPLKSST